MTFKATNTGGSVITNAISYIIKAPTPLLSGTLSNKTFTAGSAITTITLPTVTNAFGDITTYAINTGTLPQGLSLTNGSIAGTPTVSGSFALTFKASNSGGDVTTNTLNLLINAPSNLAWTPTSNTYITDYNTVLASKALPAPSGGSGSYLHTISSTNTSAALSSTQLIKIANDITAGTLNIANNLFTLIPAENFYGPLTFTYKVQDALYPANNVLSETFTITVKPYPLLIAAVDPLSTPYKATLSMYRLPTPSTGVAPYTYTIETAASHGTATISQNTFTYTPNNGYIGQDSFTFTVSDSGHFASIYSDPQTIDITVEPLGDLSGQSITLTENDQALFTNNLTNSSTNTVSTLTINLTSADQTFEGNIGTDIALIKDGVKTLTLNGANLLDQSTHINAGTLKINSANSLGSGDVILNGGTLQTNSNITLTQPVIVSHASTLDTAGYALTAAMTLQQNFELILKNSNPQSLVTSYLTLTCASS